MPGFIIWQYFDICYSLNIFLVYFCHSNRSHFGLIQSMGGGKYVCHVFAEYKVSTSDVEDTKPALLYVVPEDLPLGRLFGLKPHPQPVSTSWKLHFSLYFPLKSFKHTLFPGISNDLHWCGYGCFLENYAM